MKRAPGSGLPSGLRSASFGVWRTLALAVVGVLVAAVPVLGLAVPAEAHNYLLKSTPAAESTITELPAQFTITTNEPLLNLDGAGAGFALQVIDANGLYYGDGCLTVADATLTGAAAIGAAGLYTVRWQVVSADGHTVSDEFTFTWAPTDSNAESAASAGSKAPGTCGGASGGAAPLPQAAAPSATADADLGDVLWIGGAVVGVGIAIAVTMILTTRKRHP